MRRVGSTETSVSNYQSPLRYIPGDRRTHLHCGGGLKTKTDLLHFLWDQMCTFRSFCKIAKIEHYPCRVCMYRPSVRPHGTTRLPLDGVSWNFIFSSVFRNPVEQIQVSL